MKRGKILLIVRHGPSIHAVFKIILNAGRLRLVAKVKDTIGENCECEVFAAPEWDTRATGKDIAELVEAELVIDKSLSDDDDAPAPTDLVAKALGNDKFSIFTSHFRRMNAIIDAIESVSGTTIEIDRERMRHLNRAYLVDLANRRAYVIKEKS
jgi:hypothetical protein